MCRISKWFLTMQLVLYPTLQFWRDTSSARSRPFRESHTAHFSHPHTHTCTSYIHTPFVLFLEVAHLPLGFSGFSANCRCYSWSMHSSPHICIIHHSYCIHTTYIIYMYLQYCTHTQDSTGSETSVCASCS